MSGYMLEIILLRDYLHKHMKNESIRFLFGTIQTLHEVTRVRE